MLKDLKDSTASNTVLYVVSSLGSGIESDAMPGHEIERRNRPMNSCHAAVDRAVRLFPFQEPLKSFSKET